VTDRHAWIAIGLIVAFGLQPRSSSAIQLLDLYDEGRFEVAVDRALAGGPEGLPTLARDVMKDGPGWIAQGGEVRAARRRLVAATFTIDLTHRAFDGFRTASSYQLSQAWLRESSSLRSLVEWACILLRTTPTSSPLEQKWFVASVQLIKEMQDEPFLYGDDRRSLWSPADPRRLQQLQADYGQALNHLAHASSRVPGDSRLRLAAAERYTFHESWVVQNKRELTPSEYEKLEIQGESLRRQMNWTGLGLSDPFPNGLSVQQATILSDAEMFGELAQARRDLSAVAGDAAIRARVSLHLGCIALCFSEHDVARRYFQNIAAWTSDPCLVYLGHFMEGRIDEEDGQRNDGETAYRAALQTIPSTQSATTALAALLARDGRVADAAALIDQSLGAEHDRLDPWIVGLGRGGCSEWPSLLASLRAGLRE